MSLVPPVDPSASSSDIAASQVRAFLNVLDMLTLALSQDNEGLKVGSIQSEIAQLQPLFQSMLQDLDRADLAPVARQRIRPFQTEAHRRSRLLGVAAMQLRSAKQPETLVRVRSQLQEHLTQLQSFIQGIADVLGDGA